MKIRKNYGATEFFHIFVIPKNGEIYEGRPRHTVGAHARGYNEVRN